jgi:2-keto-4-pentenoate hydratase/2-oxohepta-3-ene-1,7-dioic acid hydratase in catechol pathway
MIAMWNNFHALAVKLNAAIPKEPLYVVKPSNSFLAGGETIRSPKSFDGKVVYEGELGIVIGKTCKAVSEADASRNIFDYTCVNDVTAVDIINRVAASACLPASSNKRLVIPVFAALRLPD